MDNYDSMTEDELIEKVDEIFFDNLSSVAPDLSAAEIADIITDTASANDGNMVTLNFITNYDYMFHWEVSPAMLLEKTSNKINTVPTAEASKYTPNTLANLCVAKILAMRIDNHPPTQELVDIDGSIHATVGVLHKRLIMFLDPTFASDYGDVTYCWELVGGVHQWLPNCWRELRLLEEYGTILALVACNTPSSMMLARNYFTTVMRRQQHLPTLPTYFGYSFKFENLPHIITALGGTINKHCNDIAILFNEQLTYQHPPNPAHKHLRAFMKRYLPEYYNDA
jgi:hypothetical protein